MNPLSGKLETEIPNADRLTGKREIQSESPVGEGKILQKNLLSELPGDLQKDILKLGRRVAPEVIDEMVHRICGHKPMSRGELTGLLGRSEKPIQDCLRRMQNSGLVKLLYPDAPSHPRCL